MMQTENVVNRLRLMQTVANILSSSKAAWTLISSHEALWLSFVSRYGCTVCSAERLLYTVKFTGIKVLLASAFTLMVSY